MTARYVRSVVRGLRLDSRRVHEFERKEVPAEVAVGDQVDRPIDLLDGVFVVPGVTARYAHEAGCPPVDRVGGIASSLSITSRVNSALWSRSQFK